MLPTVALAKNRRRTTPVRLADISKVAMHVPTPIADGRAWVAAVVAVRRREAAGDSQFTDFAFVFRPQDCVVVTEIAHAKDYEIFGIGRMHRSCTDGHGIAGLDDVSPGERREDVCI